MLCDEDIGTGVPNALYGVGYEVSAMTKMSLPKEDRHWLPIVGQRGWLVFSANKRMLWNDAELAAIKDDKIGIVYLTGGEEHPAKVLLALLRRWPDLETLHANEPRPFVSFLGLRGGLRKEWPGFPFT